MEKDILKQIKNLLFTTDETKPSTTPEIKTPEQNFAEQLKKGDAIALENGTYTIVSKEGMIESIEKIKDPETGDGSAPAAQTGGDGSNNEPSTPIDPNPGHGGFSKELTEKFSVLESKFETIEKENAELKKQVLEFGKQPGADALKIQDTSDGSSNADYSKLRKYFTTEKEFKQVVASLKVAELKK